MNKKNCYYCLHGRPKKNNFCSVHRYYVKDIHVHTCDDFLVDRWLVEYESNKETFTIEKKDDSSKNDEGSRYVLLMAA